MMSDAGKHPSPPSPAHGAHEHHEGCEHGHHPPPASTGGHDHAPTAPAGSSVHYHGDTPCSHTHAPNGSAHESHLPKGKSNTGWWVAGIVAAVGVGAYLINEYGKPKKKEIIQKSDDWKDRVDAPTTSEARNL